MHLHESVSVIQWMKSGTNVYKIAYQCAKQSFVMWPTPGYHFALRERSHSQTARLQETAGVTLDTAALAHSRGNPNTGADSVVCVSDM